MVYLLHSELRKQSPATERLRYIDLRLRFLGSIKRADVVSRFGVGTAAATRDFATYKELAPRNLFYAAADKSYRRSEAFDALFTWVPPSEVLDFLSQAQGHGTAFELVPLLAVEQSTFNPKVDNEVLAKITLAIKGRSAVSVDCLSTNHGLTTREILPHSIAQTGEGYLVRAYDRLQQEFKNFVLSAIRRAQSRVGPVFEKEMPSKDIQWNNLVQLELVAHPHNVKYPEALEVEYEMVQGVLRVTVRAALASQMLKRMSVDCSERRKLRGSAYKWWLKNRQALYGLPDLELAPGYIEFK